MFGHSEYLPLYSVLLDSGPLPLVLYSHQQVLDKIAALKENVLYCEPISAELELPKKKPKSGKGGKGANLLDQHNHSHLLLFQAKDHLIQNLLTSM